MILSDCEMAAVHPRLSTHIESNDSINQNNIIISPLNSPGPVIKLCINIKVLASTSSQQPTSSVLTSHLSGYQALSWKHQRFCLKTKNPANAEHLSIHILDWLSDCFLRSSHCYFLIMMIPNWFLMTDPTDRLSETVCFMSLSVVRREEGGRQN